MLGSLAIRNSVAGKTSTKKHKSHTCCVCLLPTSWCVFSRCIFVGSLGWFCLWDVSWMESSLKNKETNSPSLVFHNNLVCLEMMGDLFVGFFPFLVFVVGLFSPPPLPWLNSSARGPLSLAHKSLAKSWVNVWTYPGSKRERKNIFFKAKLATNLWFRALEVTNNLWNDHVFTPKNGHKEFLGESLWLWESVGGCVISVGVILVPKALAGRSFSNKNAEFVGILRIISKGCGTLSKSPKWLINGGW